MLTIYNNSFADRERTLSVHYCTPILRHKKSGKLYWPAANEFSLNTIYTWNFSLIFSVTTIPSNKLITRLA